MALERVPADIRKQGGVARMSDPKVEKRCLKYVDACLKIKSNLAFNGCKLLMIKLSIN